MPGQSVFDMPFLRIYPLLLQKAEKKGRTKEEVDAVICWLTGYRAVEEIGDVTYGAFIRQAPAWYPAAGKITGTVCGVRVEDIENPDMKKVRQLDKLIDELAKGRSLDKVLRQG